MPASPHPRQVPHAKVVLVRQFKMSPQGRKAFPMGVRQGEARWLESRRNLSVRLELAALCSQAETMLPERFLEWGAFQKFVEERSAKAL